MKRILLIVIAVMSTACFTACKEEAENPPYPPKTQFLKLVKTIALNFHEQEMVYNYSYKYNDQGHLIEIKLNNEIESTYSYTPHLIEKKDIDGKITANYKWENNHISKKLDFDNNGICINQTSYIYNMNRLIKTESSVNSSFRLNYWENDIMVRSEGVSKEDGNNKVTSTTKYKYTNYPIKTNLLGTNVHILIGLLGLTQKYHTEEIITNGKIERKMDYEFDADGCPSKIVESIYIPNEQEEPQMKRILNITYY